MLTTTLTESANALLETAQRVGRELETSWRKHNYSDEKFPALARRTLRKAELHKEFSAAQVLGWLVTTPSLPQQQDPGAQFGQPPVTLYYGSRFCIDLYFWMESTTTIHDHSFSGAFGVLQGSSVQTKYTFENRQSLNPHFHRGELTFAGAEHLTVGDVREIKPGDQFIHSVFHLEHPSVTVCIRTLGSPTPLPQCDYYPPYFAQNPFFKDPVSSRRLRAIHSLVEMKHPDCDKMVEEALRACDFPTAFSILRAGWFITEGKAECRRFQKWHRVMRARFPELAELMIATFQEMTRQGLLLNCRALTTDPDHRFFLAVFLTITSREALLEFVAKRDPEVKSEDYLTSTLRDLSEHNLLGIPPLDEAYLEAFKSLLLGNADRDDEATKRVLETPLFSAQLS